MLKIIIRFLFVCFILTATCLSLKVLALSNNDWDMLCTGFFVSKDGYIVTANHCISKRPLYVEYHGQHYQTTLVYKNSKHDFAILKTSLINTPNLHLAQTYRINEPIYVLGYPIPDTLGYRLKMRPGRILDIDENLIILNSTSCQGNSGGPVVDKSNRVIGVLTAGGGMSPCSHLIFVQRIEYIIQAIQRLNIQVETDQSNLDLGQSRIYTEDLDSVVLLFTKRQ